jgi:kynureninase
MRSSGADASRAVSPRTREECLALDVADPLAAYRAAFKLPPGIIYLDGNSLGVLTAAATQRIEQTTTVEWGTDLIKSWNIHGWIDMPARLGARIAPLVGAAADEVMVCDSTSVNLFKLASAAARSRGNRYKIITERGNFPTDAYVLQGLTALVPGLELQMLPREQIATAIDRDTFLVVLTHVHYQSAELFDMTALTARAHAEGARILWDLSHSVGALPVNLSAARADFAVGCTYKYLNGGPGAPAFMYVRRDLQGDLQPVLSGWLGHAKPFDFLDDYAPAEGMTRHRCGTPPMLSFAALDGALSVFESCQAKIDRLVGTFHCADRGAGSRDRARARLAARPRASWQPRVFCPCRWLCPHSATHRARRDRRFSGPKHHAFRVHAAVSTLRRYLGCGADSA